MTRGVPACQEAAKLFGAWSKAKRADKHDRWVEYVRHVQSCPQCHDPKKDEVLAKINASQ